MIFEIARKHLIMKDFMERETGLEPVSPAWEYGIRLNIENICGHYGAF